MRPAGSFASLDLCMQYQNLMTRTPYDKSWCGATVDYGKHFTYYNLYLRYGTASTPGTGTPGIPQNLLANP